MKDDRVFPNRLYARLARALWPAPALATASGGGSLSLFATQGSGQEPDDTIEVQRRRPSGQGAEGPRERAEAPVRRKAGAGDGGEPPRREPAGGTGSGGAPGRSPRPLSSMSLLILGAILLIIFVLPRLFGGDEQAPEATPVLEAPTANMLEPAVPAPTATPRKPAATAVPVAAATVAPAAAAPAAAAPATAAPAARLGQTWTVMLYQDADDKILEKDIYIDLNEAERVGSSDRVHIVAQMDRYRGGYQGDGNWVGAKRFYVTQDDDLEHVRSKVVQDLGAVAMSDPRTLVDFVTWAMKNYPADRYALIMSDHGMGWPGGWSDATNASGHDRSIPLVQAVGNSMYLMELDGALEAIRNTTGLDKLDLIGLDACLMAHLEVLSALAPHARYAAVSQETEPALGWAYTRVLQELRDRPDMDGAALARAIVDSYIQDDQRIVDDAARADLVGGGSGRMGLFGAPARVSAQALAQQMEKDITLSAIDLGRIPALMDSVNDLAHALQGANQQTIARARTYAQSFTSIFGEDVPPSYIDLGNFAQLLKKAGGVPAIGEAADRVLADLGAAVIAERHGSEKPGSSGISVYFPNSQLYRSPVAGPQSYTAVADRFAAESLWDDFLTYHYTGRRFQPVAGWGDGAARDYPVSWAGEGQGRRAASAPGAGQIAISPVRLSSKVAAPGKPVVMTADVSGTNIGYIYLYAGYLDEASNSIFVADMDYLASPNTQEVGGVYYPVWGDKGKFTIKFTWEPLMFSITDGRTSTLALLKPERYGATSEEAVYSVDGIYTYGDSGETRPARLYFSNGVLRHAYGFTGGAEAGAPREILPSPGDRFTVLERWMDLAGSGQPTTNATQEGKTLTFTDRTLTWKELDAAAGEYVIGFIVTDLDGNSYESHAGVTVR